MKLDYSAFTFIFTLAAVVNGLGIVRWLTALAEYLRRKDDLHIVSDRVFLLFAVFQFILHVLLWWSLWGIRAVETFDFLDYLYFLTGPTLLFLSSSLLIPSATDGHANLQSHFTSVRQRYATTLALAWAWTLFLWPVLKGVLPPTMPVHAAFLVLAIALRFTSGNKGQALIGVANWVVLVVFVSLFAMELGGVSGQL